MTDEIRINMVVNRYEHPDLHALLCAAPPKVRASLLRQHADFGLWAKANGGKFGAVATVQTSQISNDVRQTLAPVVPTIAVPVPVPAPAPTSTSTSTSTPYPAPAVTVSAASDVLDTSVLKGFDLGDLD